MCDMGNDAPSPDPLLGQAAKMNAELAEKAFEWYSKAYETDFKPRQQRTDQLTELLVSDYLDTSKTNKAMAKEQLARQKALFYPVEDQMVRDAMGYDSKERMQREAGKAAADVNQQFSNTRGQMGRSLNAYGLRPDAGSFAAVNTKLALGQALGAAGAATKARTDVQDKAIALRAGVANFGRGLGSQAAGGFSTSLAANGGAGGQNASAQAAAMQGYGVMGQGFNTAMQGWNNAGNLSYQNTMAQMQGYQIGQSGTNSLMGAVGMGVGMWAGGGFKGLGKADGGKMRKSGAIRGPGGPVDDQIPAMLSDGEYVLPADTVKAIGTKKLDKIVEKTHTPAAIQRRRAKRKGSK